MSEPVPDAFLSPVATAFNVCSFSSKSEIVVMNVELILVAL